MGRASGSQGLQFMVQDFSARPDGLGLRILGLGFMFLGLGSSIWWTLETIDPCLALVFSGILSTRNAHPLEVVGIWVGFIYWWLVGDKGI